MGASTDDVDGEAQAGKTLLVGMQAFLRLETTGPFTGAIPQVGATRKMYVSPGITAHGDDCKTFAAKVGSTLGPGNSFQMKRRAQLYEQNLVLHETSDEVESRARSQ